MSVSVDNLTAEAARLAAPVFAQNAWTYGSDNPRVPDGVDLVGTIGRLVAHARAVDLSDGGDTWVSSGRFMVRRCVDEDGDEVSVMLELGSVVTFEGGAS